MSIACVKKYNRKIIIIFFAQIVYESMELFFLWEMGVETIRDNRAL